MASNNMIKKSSTNDSDATNAHTVFGPNLAGTRGKTVQQKPHRVVMDYVSVPKDF